MKIEDEKLVCPDCGGDYLHHECVDIFSRSEDEETGRLTRAEGLDGNRGFLTISDAPESESKSARRGSISIKFRCELCGKHPVLSFSQHKGNTLVEFSVDGK